MEFKQYENVTCLYENNLPVGYVTVHKNKITSLEAFPRKQGFGTALLQEAEKQMADNGYTQSHVMSIMDTEEFYAKNGYKPSNIFQSLWNGCNLVKQI